jgi:hypothetical protein
MIQMGEISPKSIIIVNEIRMIVFQSYHIDLLYDNNIYLE